jgi:hypothetical protein
VKLGKLFGGIGFGFGFIGPILFYSVHFESHIACPLCPYITVPFAHPLLWLDRLEVRTDTGSYICHARLRNWVLNLQD